MFIWSRPEPCAKLSVYMLRMTAMSSSRRARCGYRSEIVDPACPCCANLRDEPSSVPGLRTLSSGSLSSVGIGLPLCLVSSGLGSNVSTWLTPPYMNRTMHALALAGKCGVLGASGEAGGCFGLGRGGRSREEAVLRQQGGQRRADEAARRFPEELAARAAARGQGPSTMGRSLPSLPFIGQSPRAVGSKTARQLL